MLRVASVPSAHPYVASVLPSVIEVPYEAVPDTSNGSPAALDGRAGRLPDPVPEGGPARPGVWWPARVLDPAWVDDHASLVDVAHVHFGFESRRPAELDAWVDALDRHGIPLVHTVHDLENPHLIDQTAHAEAVGLLVRRAAAVVTLTPGAAAEVEQRWGVPATVVPHPQIVPDPGIVDPPRGGGANVGMHLGAVRAGTDPTPWLRRLVAAVSAVGARLTIHVGREVADDPGPDDRRGRVLDAVRAAASHDAVDLVAVPRLDDDSLHAWVRGLDLAVLPYRHGTHSGWLEMCWDLGTPVLSPGVGHLAEQHPDPRFVRTFDPATGPTADDVAAVLRRGACPWGSAAERVAERRRQLRQVQEAHADLYERVAGRTTR